MNLENTIKDVISKKLMDGTVEQLVAEQLEKGITNALDNLFRSYGDVTKIIEDQIKSVLVPYLENYDYSHYITKLDTVLVEVLENSTSENRMLLENFKGLMSVDENKEVNVSELFNIWMKFVAEEVDTDDLEVCFDDGPGYEHVEVRMEVEEDEDRSWSSFKYATLVFECESDDSLNFAIRLSRYVNDREEGWDIQYDIKRDIRSLKYLNSFEILLMKMDQNGTKIILDTTYENDEVLPEAEPEATFD